MTKFNVTLNMSFECINPYDIEKGQEEAIERTDDYYAKNNITDYIKTFDAFGLVEYVCCEGEVLSAEWDKEKFQIHMVVDADGTADELVEELEMNSLEDGEYEACGETGWLIFTRGPNGEVYDGDWEKKDFWAYGLMDYRWNPIVVEEIPVEPTTPPAPAPPT
jgi:hypothetical protein